MNIYYRTIARRTAKYYISIHDLPIGIFQKVIKTGNYSLLVYKGSLPDSYMVETWYKIYDEFIKEFGIPDNYEQYLKLKIKYCKEMERVWLKGQKYRHSFAMIALSEAEEIINEINSDFNETLAIISKSMGFRVDPNTVTVFEFYSYIKALEKTVDG